MGMTNTSEQARSILKKVLPWRRFSGTNPRLGFQPSRFWRADASVKKNLPVIRHRPVWRTKALDCAHKARSGPKKTSFHLRRHGRTTHQPPHHVAKTSLLFRSDLSLLSAHLNSPRSTTTPASQREKPLSLRHRAEDLLAHVRTASAPDGAIVIFICGLEIDLNSSLTKVVKAALLTSTTYFGGKI